MYIRRKFDDALVAWKKDATHKPLLLRGARQTGKTTAVRELARSFDHYVEINFEKHPELCSLFEGAYDVNAICRKLEVIVRTPIVDGRTLVFFDEIQACPRAISALRYFYEDRQALHVVAAGSLLEFVFSEISDFGVGRIRNLFVYPFSFAEFATAIGLEPALEEARRATFETPTFDLVHEQLLSALKDFLVVGGMPAAVLRFVRTKNYLEVQEEQNDILTTLKADFGKYKKRIRPELVRQTLTSVIQQTGEKFTYTDSDLGLKYADSKMCSDLLCLARLVHRVESCHGNGVPLGGDVNVKRNKLLFFDTGLYLREAQLDLAAWIADSAAMFVNRGKLAEMFVGLELKKAGSPLEDNGLYYWHREAKSANAEVDYLVQHRNGIVPIEVKAGKKGAMKSLAMLMQEKGLPLGVRTSQENLSRMGDVVIIPLYLIGEFARYIP